MKVFAKYQQNYFYNCLEFSLQEEKLCRKFDICHPGQIFSFHESFRTNPQNQEVYPVLMRDVDTFYKTEKFDTVFYHDVIFQAPRAQKSRRISLDQLSLSPMCWLDWIFHFLDHYLVEVSLFYRIQV